MSINPDEIIQEEWRPVIGYEGLYDVSNYGNVRSISRKVRRNYSNGKIDYWNKPGQILKPQKSIGYHKVGLANNSNTILFWVHRLVATAFVPNPNNYTHVNHLFGNRSDNRSWMLEWSTYSLNLKHAYDVLNRQPNQIRPVTQYDLNLNPVSTFRSIKAASDSIGVAYHKMSIGIRAKKIIGGYIWQ